MCSSWIVGMPGECFSNVMCYLLSIGSDLCNADSARKATAGRSSAIPTVAINLLSFAEHFGCKRFILLALSVCLDHVIERNARLTCVAVHPDGDARESVRDYSCRLTLPMFILGCR